MALVISNNKATVKNIKYVIFSSSLVEKHKAIMIYNIASSEFNIISHEDFYNIDPKEFVISTVLDKMADASLFNYIIDDALNELKFKFNNGWLMELLYNKVNNYNAENPLLIPVKVIGGRKYRNMEGLLLYSNVYESRFGISEHHNIFNPQTKSIVHVNSLSYLIIDDEWKTKFNNAISEIYINNFNLFEELSDILFNNLINNEDFELITRHGEKLTEKVIDIIKEQPTEYTEFLEEKKKSFDKKLVEELPNIIEWVKKNTGKEGKEIVNLAEHIFRKRNKIDYEH